MLVDFGMPSHRHPCCVLDRGTLDDPGLSVDKGVDAIQLQIRMFNTMYTSIWIAMGKDGNAVQL
jgi:hypothetical protein